MRRLRPGTLSSTGSDLGAASLAPLVDILTLTLLFLLRAWSADPPVRLGEDFQLVRSAGEEESPRMLAVDLSPRGIHVGDVRIGGARYYQDSEEILVRELYDVMLARGGEPVALRVDARVSWVIVRKVLFTLQEAGVSDVHLVAESKAGL